MCKFLNFKTSQLFAKMLRILIITKFLKHLNKTEVHESNTKAILLSVKNMKLRLLIKKQAQCCFWPIKVQNRLLLIASILITVYKNKLLNSCKLKINCDLKVLM